MDPRIQKELTQEMPTSFHRTMLESTMNLITLSRGTMDDYYDQWDTNDEVYRNRRQPDKDDVKAADRKEPIKMVVPISYSQVQAFVSFCFELYTQRERFFELVAVEENSHKAAKIAETFLQRDLSHNIWEARLYQFLLDVARFGLGVFKIGWTQEYELAQRWQQGPAGTSFLQTQRVLRYAGNKIFNVSPYQFFPDPRIPIARMQEGEFVGMEQVYSRHTLLQMEANGVIAGMQYVPKLSSDVFKARNSRVYGMSGEGGEPGAYNETSSVIVTEVQRSIVPSEFEIDGKPLGPEKEPVKYNIWYANDERIIKCEPLGYLHGEYTYTIGEYNPDVLNFQNPGLQDSIDMLQDTLSWFINSRITNVRKIISNRLIVDPSGVEMKDITERSPVIRLKPNVARLGVDKYIQQLDLQDVTTNHLQDAQVLHSFVKETTGLNDTLMGDHYPGRRSATENRNATSAAAARLKMIALLLYRNSLERLGRQALSNLRDGLDEVAVARIVGPMTAVEGVQQFIKANKLDLIGEYDFELFDGTLPSEKVNNAQALGEVLSGFMSNPQAALALQLDPQAIMLEWLELRGIRNPKRFLLPTTPQLPPNGTQNQGIGTQQGGSAPGVPGAPGQPVLPGTPPPGGGQA